MTHSVTGNAFIRVEPMLATIEQAAPITNTNLIDVLNTKLASLPEQHIANVCHEEHDMCMPNGKCNMQKKWLACDALRIPHPCHSRHVCTAVNDKLKVGSPLFVVKGPDVSLGQPNLDAIPTSVLTSVGTYTNCSSLQQSQTFTHSEQVTIGNTITKTKILQTGSNLGAGISGSVKLGPLTLGGNTSLQINTTTSLSEADTDNHTETKTEQIQLPLQVPSMAEVSIAHSFIVYHVPVPFSGTITVDGQLGSNLANLNTLSQAIPTESDRTFSFGGIVTDSTLMDAKTMTYQRALSVSDCGTNANLTVQLTGAR